MIKIRENVFETNSSSTHSLVMPKKPVYGPYHSYGTVWFRLSHFGWEWAIRSGSDYLFTYLYLAKTFNYVDSDLYYSTLRRIMRVCKEHEVDCIFCPYVNKDGKFEDELTGKVVEAEEKWIVRYEEEHLKQIDLDDQFEYNESVDIDHLGDVPKEWLDYILSDDNKLFIWLTEGKSLRVMITKCLECLSMIRGVTRLG